MTDHRSRPRPVRRPRLHQRHLIALGCLMLLLLAALLPTGRDSAAPEPLAIGPSPAEIRLILSSGPVGSTAFAVGGALCAAVNRDSERTNLRCSVSTSDGPIDNLDHLRRGDADLANVRSDWLHHAYHGTDIFTVDGAADHALPHAADHHCPPAGKAKQDN